MLNDSKFQFQRGNFMKKLSTTMVVLTAIFAAAGCSTFKKNNDTTVDIQTYTPIQIISQESQKALNAQQILTKYKQAQNQTLDMRQKSFETDKILVDFIGNPRNVISSIAIKYGYRFIELGNPTSLPTVNFTQVHSTPEELLINLNAKLSEHASIAINKNEKVITLVY